MKEPKDIRILVACEESATVREAFAARGFDAWSCDIQPTRIPGNHIQGDVIPVLSQGWDLIIAHPPCTYLSYAGMAQWTDEARTMKRIEAAAFFMQCMMAPADFIAVENPLGIMSKLYREHDQIVHPYYFGDAAMKRTCLWLKGLPPLKYALQETLFEQRTAVDAPEPDYVHLRKATGKVKKRYFTEAAGSPKARSKTFPSIADAMAAQWGDYILNALNK